MYIMYIYIIYIYIYKTTLYIYIYIIYYIYYVYIYIYTNLYKSFTQKYIKLHKIINYLSPFKIYC